MRRLCKRERFDNDVDVFDSTWLNVLRIQCVRFDYNNYNSFGNWRVLVPAAWQSDSGLLHSMARALENNIFHAHV